MHGILEAICFADNCMKFLKCLPTRRKFLEEMPYTLLIRFPEITPCGMQEGSRKSLKLLVWVDNVAQDQLNVTNTLLVWSSRIT